jgi:hypothetical protein
MNYFFKKNNATFGPIPLADLLKIIDANTEVSEDGTQWVLAQDVPMLAAALGIGKPLVPPPLPKSKPIPPPPVPSSIPRQRVMPPLQNPQKEKSGGISLPMVLVGIAIVGLLIFVGVAYMDGPGNSSYYTPPHSNNINDYNQDDETSSSKTDETPATEYQAPVEAKPQKTQCITCQGIGYFERNTDCTACEEGTMENGSSCPYCYGDGITYETKDPCKSCEGDGWVND